MGVMTPYPQSPPQPPTTPPIIMASPNSPSALSTDSDGNFSQNRNEEPKEKRMNTGMGPPVERETGRLNLTRNPSYRPSRHPTTPLVII